MPAVIDPSSRIQSNRHSSSAMITSSTPVNSRSSRGGHNILSQSLAHLQNQHQNNENVTQTVTKSSRDVLHVQSLQANDDQQNDEQRGDESSSKKKGNLFLGLTDKPNVYISLLLGLQQYITMLGGTVTYPYILTSKLCMRDSDPARGYVIATTLFCSGVASFIQTTFGIRLPVIQGATFTFLVPTLAILSLPQWTCPSDFEIISGRSTNSTYRHLRVVAEAEYTEVWQSRMREIQGAIIVSSLVEVFLGLTGIMGLMLRFITPLSIVPTVSLVGLSLFKEATAPAGESWFISGITIVMVILLSQYFVNWAFKIPFYSKEKRFHWKKVNVIKMFPVLLTMVTVWLLCVILTLSNVLPRDHPGRTDGVMSKLVTDSPWFRIPYPHQWGVPTISASAVLGMTAGVIASAIESVGDYYGCARLCEVPSPPTHAMNRGIFMEGLGCIFAGVMGSGGGLTSYSENIGAIGITRVASRRVVQAASLLMIILSIFVKFSAVFATIPIPIIGGILMTMFGICCAVGLSTLQFVDLNSSRNLFILGSSLFLGLSIPKWVLDHPEQIRTGSSSLNQIIYILLSTSMLVGGVIACFLDNTIPGSDEERGVTKWLKKEKKAVNGEKSAYDLPKKLNDLISEVSFLRFLPISPTYRGSEVSKKVAKVSSRVTTSLRKRSKNADEVEHNSNEMTQQSHVV